MDQGLEEEYDAGNVEHVRERIAVSKRRSASNRAVIRSIMSSNEGRDWIYNLLQNCHVYSSSFSGNALTMAYAEGERNIGLRLMAELVSATPERYLEMLAEHGDSNV
jgi:hypothetical protein